MVARTLGGTSPMHFLGCFSDRSCGHCICSLFSNQFNLVAGTLGVQIPISISVDLVTEYVVAEYFLPFGDHSVVLCGDSSMTSFL